MNYARRPYGLYQNPNVPDRYIAIDESSPDSYIDMTEGWTRVIDEQPIPTVSTEAGIGKPAIAASVLGLLGALAGVVAYIVKKVKNRKITVGKGIEMLEDLKVGDGRNDDYYIADVIESLYK